VPTSNAGELVVHTVVASGDDPHASKTLSSTASVQSYYTTSTALLEGLREAGVRYLLANFGSAHAAGGLLDARLARL
jgi:hypothetical protein